MDPVRNPFAPGAGSQPPQLAGREDIITQAKISIKRVAQNRNAQSQILLGLRGTGKTVLLNKIERLAEEQDCLTSFIEAPDVDTLARMLFPRLQQVLYKLSLSESAKAKAHNAMRALKSFAGTFKIEWEGVSLSVDPQQGRADSGNLEYDLAELFQDIGAAAKAAGRPWVLLIDEIQYLEKDDWGALIVALHRAAQRNLPILLFGAGLPQVASLSGNAKSYAERLFSFREIGPLDKTASTLAIASPIEAEGEMIEQKALNTIYSQTEGYPYFLQEWGFQAWNLAHASPINNNDIIKATQAALKRLDEGFFRVRFDRLSPKERDYVIAMANLGDGPYRSGDVAHALNEAPTRLGPRRAAIISKGMIYSPAHGDIAFTVPKFADFLRRLETSSRLFRSKPR